ncbi:MAG: glycerophosphoryl diester phosphodiesterase membrane domain-containing protein [Gemmatimonadota bacterium]|nr:glycerophosphoryl diester phosphodiesterase membrane domain-containing protein [Gemmatimonadota bacterium]
MSDTNLRTRSVSEIVDAAFALYRRNAMQYIVITALATAPQLILTLLIQGTVQPKAPGDLLRLLPVYLLGIVTYSLVAGVVMRMGSDVYLGEEPDVGRTVKAVLPRVPALITGTLVTAILAAISMVLFILPVFYVLARFFAVQPAIVLENKGPLAALSRSGTLSYGRKWPILGTLVLVWGIFMILSVGITLLVTMIGSTILVLIASTLFSVLASPILHLVGMVLYYDARIRAEGFDVEHMSQSLGAAAPTASPMTAPAV